MTTKRRNISLEEADLAFLQRRLNKTGASFSATIRIALRLLKKKEGVPHESRNL